MDEISQLIAADASGTGVDSAALFQAAYGELRKLAHARLSNSGKMTLIETTVLVNECWLRICRQQLLQVETRCRFFAYASDVMRSVIVDEVRERMAAKRGGGQRPLTLNTAIGDSVAGEEQVLHVHDALASLATCEPRLAKVVEMRYFGGLTETQIGETLGVTERTVRRDWEKARLLLRGMLDVA
jgi:RNA polymerase sigma factor (TIGR02999 family)